MIGFLHFKKINKVDTVMGNYLSGTISEVEKNSLLRSRKEYTLAEETRNNWDLIVKLLKSKNIKFNLVGYIEVITRRLIYKIRVSSLGFLYQTVDGLGRESDVDILDLDDVNSFVEELS